MAMQEKQQRFLPPIWLLLATPLSFLHRPPLFLKFQKRPALFWFVGQDVVK